MKKSTCEHSRNVKSEFANLYTPGPNVDQIDLREVWSVVWGSKWIILVMTSVFAAGSVVYALSLPNIYESRVLLAPAKEAQRGGVSRMAGQLGGLASLAGISLGAGPDNQVAKAIEVIKSHKFISRFIERHSALPELMAIREWNFSNNELIFNPEIYDVAQKKWVREVNPPKSVKPSAWEAYKEFSKIMTVIQNPETGFVTVAVQHKSPYVAKKWTALLVEDVNTIMREHDISEAQKSIDYLQQQLAKVSVADMRNIFYQLIEEQTKIVMLAVVREEYVFSVIDPPVAAEEKASPNRALICVIGTVVGGLLAIMFAFTYFYATERKR